MSHLLTLFPQAPADAPTPPIIARGEWTLADDLFVAGLPEEVRAFIERVRNDDDGVAYQRGHEAGYEAGKEVRADAAYDDGEAEGRRSALREVESRIEQAREEGYAAGLAAGRAERAA